MDPLEILSRIYSLLSECESGDIRAAAEIAKVSPELTQALKSLAAAKKQIERRGERMTRREPRESAPAPAGRNERPVGSQGKERTRNGYEAVLRKIVLEKGIFESNEDLARYLTGLGFGIGFRGKDGRSEMLSRLLRHFDRLDQESRKESLSRLMAILPKSETAGWFEAIRRDT